MSLTAEQLEAMGGSAIIPLAPGQRMGTWYTPDGRKLRLPMDPYSIEKYARKGFTLTPPVNPAPLKVANVGVYDKDDEGEPEPSTQKQEGVQLSFITPGA